jgi:hypothetical protein
MYNSALTVGSQKAEKFKTKTKTYVKKTRTKHWFQSGEIFA